MTNHMNDPAWNGVEYLYRSGDGIAVNNAWMGGGDSGGPECLEYWQDDAGRGHVQLIVKNKAFGPFLWDGTDRKEELYEMVSKHSSVFIGFATGPYDSLTVYVDEKYHPRFQEDHNPVGVFHRSKHVNIPTVNHISIPTCPRNGDDNPV